MTYKRKLTFKPTKEQIAKTRRRMLKLYNKERFGCWSKVTTAIGINQTTCSRIAQDLSYFPKDPEILIKLGIPPVKRHYKDLFSIPVDELKWMIENREEF